MPPSAARREVPIDSATELGPVRFVTDYRLDFNHFTPVRKSYIVASSYRSGSQYLCWRLWQTGVLGAPSEVLNPTSELRVLTNRFKASSPSDYMTKLLGRRTTRNGVFGMKAHFHHFETFLKDYPRLLEVLAPVSYIYISRQDRVAQAVSMAKALQTNMWTSRMEEEQKPALRYDRDMITKCLADVEQQDLTWREWFRAHAVEPFEVTYDQLTSDPTRVVGRIVALMGVQHDDPEPVNVPPAKKQGDETNEEWISRYERESMALRQGSSGRGDAAPATDVAADDTGHFFDRYAAAIQRLPTGGASATGFLDFISLRRRYDTILARHREMFEGARVVDLMSSYGFWSLAALDAGAAHVIGIESSAEAVTAARATFTDCGQDPSRFEFINDDLFAGLQGLQPRQADVVLCQSTFEQVDVRLLFEHLFRLQPKQIILDTAVVPAEGPVLRFTLNLGDVLGSPNHSMIMFLCDVYGFRWRLVNWRGLGLSDWAGIHEYERDQRRTYILERID